MKIGLLLCGALPQPCIQAHGDYSELYQELLGGQGFSFESWNVYEGDFPDSADAADGWLVSGSKHGAYEDLAWIPALEDFIRASVDSARPIVGICFGHQIIAQALGGKVEKFSDGWTVGRQVYDFSGLDLPLMAWHQDQVTEIPDGVQIIASSDRCTYAALLYGNRAFTLQPHPEFDGETVEILAEVFKPSLTDDQVDAVLSDVNDPVANEIIADQISDFFRQARNP